MAPDSVSIERVALPPFDGDSADPRVCHFFGALVNLVRPLVVVEAGTYKGHSTLLAAFAVKHHGINCEIWTADIHDLGPPERFVQFPFVHFCFMDFEKMLTEHIAPRSVQLAFIDSGPADGVVEEGMRFRHYEAVKPYMASGGLIVVDDMSGNDWLGCAKIWREASLVLPHARGLAIVQR